MLKSIARNVVIIVASSLIAGVVVKYARAFIESKLEDNDETM